jgi:hypothetical protein
VLAYEEAFQGVSMPVREYLDTLTSNLSLKQVVSGWDKTVNATDVRELVVVTKQSQRVTVDSPHGKADV